MAVLIPKAHLVPPGGFHFVDAAGHRIEGPSYESVASALLKYRLDNKLPIGNPFSEVLDFVCNQHPHLCSRPKTPVMSVELPLVSRVTQWVARMYQTLRGSDVTAMFVDQKTADARSEICAACPRNVPWMRGGCGTCMKETQHIAFTFRGGRKASRESNLRACSVAGHENATAVWLKIPHADPTEWKAHLPANCWMK
jgi:hypothetical protein